MKFSKSIIIVLVSLAILTVVVGVGLLFFYPKEPAKTAAAPVTPSATTPPATPVPNEFDPVEWTRNPTTPALQPSTTPAPGDQNFTVTLPPAETTPTTVLPPSPGATFPGETTPTTVKTPNTPVSTPVGAPKAAPEAAPAPAPKAAPASVPKAKPAPKVVKTVKVTEYWVQVGSFKDRYQADNTAKLLEAQGLKGTLTTATVNGLAVVRVRVGPYTAEAEAQKYLAKLTPVKEFASAYVTKVNATRTAP